MKIYEDLLKKKKRISVTGLGYVGLPLALEFAKHFSVIGFDISEPRIQMMKDGIDPSNELNADAFLNKDIVFTSDPELLSEAHFHIIGVPTDIDVHKVPNLNPLLSASKSVGKALKKGDYVVYESTVYPGCTEEDCLPELEKYSSLKVEKDFKIGYSPERINPGDKEHSVTQIAKIVSGCDEESLNEIYKVYKHIIEKKVHKAQSIKVAEAAKVIENTQRDINIALMNELSMIFDRMGIDTKEVIEAASTKWNFLHFYPGLVGGHCIGVDPYYLTYKAQKMGFIPQMILSGRKTNEDIPGHIAKRLVQYLIKADKNPGKCSVLIMGFTFKENVSDIRNTKIIDIINELKGYGIFVDVVDPHAQPQEVKEEYGIDLLNEPINRYDAVLVTVAHQQYMELDSQYFKKILKPGANILFDLKGIVQNVDKFAYWRL